MLPKEFRSLGLDEVNVVTKVFARRKMNPPIGLGVGYERQGRFTLCVLSVRWLPDETVYPWGAVRQDSKDADNPVIGQQIALAKAARMLAEKGGS